MRVKREIRVVKYFFCPEWISKEVENSIVNDNV